MVQWAMLSTALAVVLATASPARADTVEYGGEKYQDHLVDSAREQSRLEYEPQPEGKTIERIVTVPFDVLTPGELHPLVLLLNGLHVTTLPDVVERELVFHAGDPWSESAVIESAHNLRTYLLLSAARIVACKGSSSDRVVALVVTKDLWSLRPNVDFQFASPQLQALQTQLTEQNLFGRMKQAALDLGFTLDEYNAGLLYQDPRLFGGDVSMLEHGDLLWNRISGGLEGGVVNFVFQKPLYTLDTKWAWVAAVRYRKDIRRLYIGDNEAGYTSPTTGETLPYEFNRHLLDGQFGVIRSYGYEFKQDFSAGYRGFVHLFSPNTSSLLVNTQADPTQTPVFVAPQAATLADFNTSVVPLSETAGMLYVGYHAYEGSYHSLIDIEDFAVSEDFRFGLDFSAELRLANPVFGFASSYFEPVVNLTWTHYAQDDLFIASAGLDARYQPQLGGASPWVNGLVSLGVRNVTPRVSFLRLHTALQAGRRVNDLANSISTLGGSLSARGYPTAFFLSDEPLGGDTSLRGYPTSFFVGDNFWAGNAELRTIPLAIASVHLGLATFFDIGSAATNLAQLTPHESVGAGLRVGFPQFNKEVLRVDFGVPLETITGATPAYVVAEWGQAF